MTKLRNLFLILFIIALCVGCDQITKRIAASHLPRHRVYSFVGDALRLDYNENEGAVLSFEPALPEKWRGSVVTFAVSLFLGLLLLYLMLGSGLQPFTVVALSLFCGGAMSNMLDRVALGGNVVDFLNIGWGGFRTCIFNVADIAIIMGLALFALHILWNFRPWAPNRRSRHANVETRK